MLNTCAATYLCMRIAYIAVYISVTSQRRSLIRTGIWLVSTLMCMGIFVRAGIALA
jgi:uncharacterized MAPEG superfamily protein